MSKLCRYYYKCKSKRKNKDLCQEEHEIDFPRDGCPEYALFQFQELCKRRQNESN